MGRHEFRLFRTFSASELGDDEDEKEWPCQSDKTPRAHLHYQVIYQSAQITIPGITEDGHPPEDAAKRKKIINFVSISED